MASIVLLPLQVYNAAAPFTASAHLRLLWLDSNLGSLHDIIPNVIIVSKVLLRSENAASEAWCPGGTTLACLWGIAAGLQDRTTVKQVSRITAQIP